MYTNRSDSGSAFLSWQSILLQILLVAGLAVYLDKPTGSLAGNIALEKPGFGLFTYDIHDQKVYAIAEGPRGPGSVERGVWIKKDGSFEIDRLAIGEYQLKVRAPGYGNESVYGLLVEEGQIKSIPQPIKMSVLRPSISLATAARVFTTKELPSFWVNATGVGQTTVKLYKKDMVQLQKSGFFKANDFELTRDFHLSNSQPQAHFDDLFPTEKPVLKFTRKLEQDYEDSSRAQFKCENPLPPGDYLMQVVGTPVSGGADNVGDLSWFTVTDLGLIVKDSPNQILVRAIDLNTLKPIANASIKAAFGDHKPLVQKTGADGFTQFAMSSKNENTGDDQDDTTNSNMLCVVGSFGDHRAYGNLTNYNQSAETYRTYFYTERPIYRLGQTVYFKGMARRNTPEGFKNPGAGLELALEVKDPEGNALSNSTLHTTTHGTFNGLVEIPADAKTGGYSINITYPDQSTSNQYFEVAEYRKPEYQVEVIPQAPQVVAGDKTKARVHATYYFGGPVANASVKYTIFSHDNWGERWDLITRPSYYGYFDDWEGSSSYGGDYGGDVVSEGFAQTDANGDAQIEFETKRDETPKTSPYDSTFRDKTYKVQAEVTDLSRLTVVGSSSLSVTQGSFAVFVQPKSYVVAVGDKMPVDVQAIGYDKKPVANQSITLKIERWPWDRIKQTYAPIQDYAEQTVTTDAQGKATASFDCQDQWPTDNFTVEATARDSGGHSIHDSSSIWIANSRIAYLREGASSESQALNMHMDKEVYKPGETAKVMVAAPVQGNEGASVIVSIEGPKIYSYKVLPMDATAKLVEVPIKNEYAPNVFINLTLVDKHHRFYTQEQMIKVSPENNFLQVAIKSDKEKYKPGENVKYTITAKRADGSPAADTDLSLGVVDESIYAVRPETAEDIRKAFYNRRENAVATACSFPEEYSGGPDKAEPAMRKDFKDTAAWIPEVVTNKDGIANVSVKLPDNLTTWRATVRGIDMQTDVGSSTGKIMCTKDMILRLALPRFFTQGDDGLVTAIVHNYTKTPQRVNLSLALSRQFKTADALKQKIQIEPEKAARFSWHISVIAAGVAVIQAKAIGQGVGDAVEQKLPVDPLGIPAFSSKGGLVMEDSKAITIPIGLSSDANRATAKYELNLASSSIGPVLGNFGSLIDYPYGCTEQTMSKLIPSVVAKQLQIKLHQPISTGDQLRFEKAYNMSMKKLTGYHHNDGGWGWWETDQSNPYLTAYVVDGLRMLKEVGYAPEQSLIDTGRKWLATSSVSLYKQLADPKVLSDDYWGRELRVDLARMIYTSSLWHEKTAPAVTKFLIDARQRLTPEADAYLAMAYHNQSDEVTAKRFYNRLIELSNKDGDFMNWEHGPVLLKKLQIANAYSDYSYRFTSVESTALALKAVLTVDPDNIDRIEAIKRWILIQRNKDGWDNTKTTAEVFLVLMQDELQARGRLGHGNFTARVSLDNKSLTDFLSNEDNLYLSQKTVNVPIPADRSTLTIQKDGPGRLYYNTLITYFRNMKPGDQLAYKGLPTGLKITRQFFRVKAGAVTSDGTIHYHSELIKDGMVKAGETVLMKVFVESPIRLPYIMVQAALPSGAEVVAQGDSAASDSNTSDDGPKVEGDWSIPWWTHEDVLDDRIVFFGTQLREGKSEFHTMLRMELPGNIQVNPVSLEGMYTNAVRGYSPLDQLHVND